MEREEDHKGSELDLESELRRLREQLFDCLGRLFTDDVGGGETLAALRDIEARLSVVQRAVAMERRLRRQDERQWRRLIKAALRSREWTGRRF